VTAKQSGKARRAAAERQRQRARAHKDAQGRLHLVVHRDPASGHEQLALAKPVFKSDWQNDIVAGAANTAHSLLQHGLTGENAVLLANNTLAAMSRLSEALLAQAPAGAVACKAGCDHCCYQVVGATPPEVLAIVHHLRQTRSSEELERLREHVATLFERAHGLSSNERFSPEHPCAFLKEGGSCSIYEVRPLACRGMNSLDAVECATRLRDPQARSDFLAAGRGGHSYLEPIGAAQAISAGMQLELSELHHLDMRPLDLLHAVHLLLGDDGSRVTAWLTGARPFEAAVTDTANEARLRELTGALAPGDATRR
jgi:hypothetical protein